ncbi:MAG: response regulator [Bacteroidales bacterium]|nr:response regulator [Bacteroidales bacterium]
MSEEQENKSDRLSKLVKIARLGWWEADYRKQEYICSDFLVDLYGLEGNILSFRDFCNLVREDYRDRMAQVVETVENREYYEHTYPIRSRYGEIWVRSAMGSKEYDKDGNLKIFGYTQCLPVSADENPEETVTGKMNNLFSNQNVISHLLLSLLFADKTEEALVKVLANVREQLQVERIYVVEFHPETGMQEYLSEALAPGVASLKGTLREIPLSATPWRTRRLLKENASVMLSTLDDLPPAAKDEKTFLRKQGVKSVLIVPMYARNKVNGYLAIDTLAAPKLWTHEEYQRLSAFANILSICLNLRDAERKVEEDRRYLGQLYKNMPVGYVRMKLLYDGEGHVNDYILLEANEKAVEIAGTPGASNIGRRASELGIDLKMEIPRIEEILHAGTSLKTTYRVPKNGKYCHAVVYSPRKDEIVSFFSDKTELFTVYETLEKKDKMLSSLFTHLPIGVELYDKDGKLIDINEKEFEIFGIDKDKMPYGIDLFSNPNVPDEIKEKIKNRENVDFRIKYEFSKLKGYFRSNKTGTIDLVSKITCILDGYGRPLNYLFINIDNTETTSAYTKIQEFENFFSVIAGFAKVGYFRWNPVKETGFAIEQWFKNMGEPEGTKLKDVVGLYRHLHPDDRDMMRELYCRVVKGELRNAGRDVRVKRDDGAWRWLRCSITAKEDEHDNTLVMTGVNFDITEMKEIEEKLIVARDKAETLDRLKSAFLANMSHEIRTPLNAIVGFSNLLIEADDLEEKRRYMTIVRENNNLLLQLISDILDLSKIEAGLFEISNDKLDVNLLCEEIVCSYRIKSTEKVKILFGEHLPECFISGDRRRLTQVITNFINNALKFTEQGTITLGYRIEENKKEIVFYVEDTGTGISHENLATIFERFVQLDDFTPGTGLGLSISKSIVKQMGGEIGVDSVEGEGSCFWFTVPYMEAPQQEEETGLLKKYPVAGNTGSAPLVLVAEDTDSNYLLMSTVLGRNYKLLRAHNGREAVEMYRKHRPDIILMDVRMPVLDGLEATKQIRAENAAIPIIAVTAFAFDQDRKRALAAGCNDYVSKPIDSPALRQTIEKWLCRKE